MGPGFPPSGYPPSGGVGPGFPPSGYPRAAPARPTIRPSGWWFLAAGGIAVLGLAVAVGLVVRGVVTMTQTIDDFDRAPTPATLQVEIGEPGGYTIYHEVDHGLSDRVRWGTLQVTVTAPSGAPVGLDAYDSTVFYDFGGHDGVAVYSFAVDETGTYTVDASMSRNTDFGVDVVAVGPGLGSGLVDRIAAAVVVGLAACVAGAVIAIVVGVRRGRSRRAQAPPVLLPGYGPPPGAPGAGPPAGWGAPPPGWGAPPPGSGPSVSGPSGSGPPPGAPPQDRT